MEDQHIRRFRQWVLPLAILAGFSIQTGLALDPDPPQDFYHISSAQGADSVTFTFGCIDGHPGDTLCIPVTVDNFNDIVIAQFEIFWNSDVLDYIEVSNPGSPSINVNADFNLSGPNALKFIPLGFPIDGESLPDGTVLFEICFRVIGIPGSSSCIGISPYFDFEVADANGVVPSDSVNCCLEVDNAIDLVGFLTSCGPAMIGGNGTIDVTVYGGMALYGVQWENTITGAIGSIFPIPNEGGMGTINVPAGNYDVTITDALGNIVVYNVDVAELALTFNARPKDPTCYKFANGTISITPAGGTEPYSYIWESLTDPTLAGSGFIRNLGDSSLITSLPDGIYHILVQDDNGCEAEITDTLNDNPFIITVNDLIDATCIGDNNGVIDLSISGATPGPDMAYEITWPLFMVTQDEIQIGLLEPGTYTITISDDIPQCDTVYSFTIGYTDTITALITPTDPPCAGSNNGSVAIRGLTNGVPGPSYRYNIYENGILITSQVAGGTLNYSPLGPGTYAVIVEEGPCTSDSMYFTLTEPLPLLVSLEGLIPDNCIPAQNTGDVWFNITNGVGPYILDVGPGFQDGDTIFNIGTGNYTLTVTDEGTGCTATLPFTMPDFTANEEADISFVFDGTPCDGGTVTVLYQGGSIPASAGVLWSPGGEIDPTIPIIATDTLSVNVILPGPIFCILSDTVHVECEEVLKLDITVIQPLCGEGAQGGPYTGTVIVDTSNAVPPVTWIWSFPDTTTTGLYSGLSPGIYYVTVTDGLDSVAVDSFEIIAPNTISLQFTNIDSTSCADACDGGVRIVPGDGDPTLDYFLYWDPINPQGDTGVFFNISDLCGGEQIFTVSQDGICFYNDTVEILSPDSIVVNLIQNLDVICHGGDDGLLEVAAIGGTPGYTYSWTGGPSSALNQNLEAGTYHVLVTDSHNCTQTDSFEVIEPDTLIADIDSSNTLNLSCGGSDDGIITINFSGGNPGNYTFTWNPDVSSTYQAVNLSAGHYTITVTDVAGCTDTTSYTLTAPLPITVTWPIIETPACFGDETILLIEEVSGGSGNYTFNVNGGELHDIGEPILIPSGIYVVTVFDDRGCSTDTMYTVIEPNPIIVSIGPDDPIIDLGDSLFILGHVDQSDLPILMTLWTSAEPVSCDTCEGTWVFNSLPTVYTWTVTDENGCTGSANITVNVDYDRDVFIPNIFSPNDDGRNDEFKVYTGLGVVSINFIHIYDRWGNLVHSETNLLPSADGAGTWDGSKKGEDLNPGVFVYVVEITFIDNNTTLTYSGDITLVKSVGRFNPSTFQQITRSQITRSQITE